MGFLLFPIYGMIMGLRLVARSAITHWAWSALHNSVINTSEATKRLSNRTENGKCTDVTNRWLKSCRLVNPNLHKPRLQLQDATFVLVTKPDHRLFWWVFSLPRIFTDLIMHNYWSNQSALMTRWGTDFRHQYGIFGGESQTFFTRNATRARSEEGRLSSQASQDVNEDHKL